MSYILRQRLQPTNDISSDLGNSLMRKINAKIVSTCGTKEIALGFRFTGSKKYNYAKITRNSDNYKVRLVLVSGFKITRENTFTGIQRNALCSLFEAEL